MTGDSVVCNNGYLCWELPADFVPEFDIEEHIAKLMEEQKWLITIGTFAQRNRSGGSE